MKISFDQICRALEEKDDICILTHKRPDGDTLGSASALCLALRQKGKNAWLCPNSGTSAKFFYLTDGLWGTEGQKAGCVCSVDIADTTLLPPEAQVYDKIDLAIDHHPSFKDFADLGYCRPEAAGCGEIIYDIIKEWGCEFDSRMADAVYTAISTDTGCFCFSNTTAYTHVVAAECMKAGADFSNINYNCFRLKSQARIALEGHIFSSVRFLRGGRGAAAVITQQLIGDLRATDDDCDNLASLITQVDGVKIGALLTELKEGGGFRVSMRGRGYDVSQVCGRFGGGGHAGAAGCTLKDMDADQALETICTAIGDALDA